MLKLHPTHEGFLEYVRDNITGIPENSYKADIVMFNMLSCTQSVESMVGNSYQRTFTNVNKCLYDDKMVDEALTEFTDLAHEAVYLFTLQKLLCKGDEKKEHIPFRATYLFLENKGMILL